jgi:NADH-quinone oxidoreductase subunit C
MAEITNAYLLNALKDHLGEDLFASGEPYGMLTVEIHKKRIIDTLRFLFNHPEIRMQFLTDLCGIHYPQAEDKELGVIYHVHSLVNNIRLRIKCFMADSDHTIDSVTPVYSSANWMERETYDFFGINFAGHPDLKRILNVEEMAYFPLRKEYPLEDQGRTDKNDKYFGR